MKNARNGAIGFAVALIIPLLILAGVASKPLLATTLGEEILLATDAYDPRDLFRGDYVHLNLEINRGTSDQLSEAIYNDYQNFNNEFVYVELGLDERGFHVIDTISEKPPSDGVYLKTRISGMYSQNGKPLSTTVYLNYGLERYYVQENTGEDLQYDSNDGILDVRVKVYKGYGYITGLEKRD